MIINEVFGWSTMYTAGEVISDVAYIIACTLRFCAYINCDWAAFVASNIVICASIIVHGRARSVFLSDRTYMIVAACVMTVLAVCMLPVVRWAVAVVYLVEFILIIREFLQYSMEE